MELVSAAHLWREGSFLLDSHFSFSVGHILLSNGVGGGASLSWHLCVGWPWGQGHRKLEASITSA